MFPFYTLWKHQKTFGFLVFSGGIKWEHLPEMGLKSIEKWKSLFVHFIMEAYTINFSLLEKFILTLRSRCKENLMHLFWEACSLISDSC